MQGQDTMTGYDCLIIPNAVKAGGTSQLIGNQFCGKFLVTASNQASGKTVCSKYFSNGQTSSSLNDEYVFSKSTAL